MLLVKELPVLSAVHHWPPCSQRPVMSALPSPLKSPTLTSTQVAPVLHVVQTLVVAAVLPPLRLVHHCPLCNQRPVMSVLPSPLKSPALTSTQVTGVMLVPVDQVAQMTSSKVAPLERASCQSPVLPLRPMMSCLPSPLKSPT